MTKRTFLSAGRLIITKPGYEASPSVAEVGKSFDSDWSVMGRLIANGIAIDPAAPISGNADRTSSAAAFSIVFPLAFRFPPTVRLFILRPSRYASGDIRNDRTDRGVANFSVGTTGITFPRLQVPGSSPAVYYRFHYYYQVLGI